MHFKHISTRITLIFSLLALVIMSAYFISTSKLFSDQLTLEMNSLAKEQLNFSANKLDQETENVRSLYYSILRLPSTQNVLTQYNKSPSSVTSDQLSTLSNRLSSESDSYGTGLRSQFLLSKDLSILNELYQSDNYNWIIYDNSEFDAYFDSNQFFHISSPNNFPLNSTNEELNTFSSLTCFCKLYTQDTYETLGYLVLNLNYSLFFSDFSSSLQDSFEKTYIVDENGHIIFGDSTFLNQKNSFLLVDYGTIGQQVDINNKSYLAYSKKLETYPKWNIVAFTNYDEMMFPIIKMLQNGLLILCFSFVLLVLANNYFAKHIATPILEVNKTLKSIGEGKWPAPLITASHDEIKILVTGVNEMNQNLQVLTTNIANKEVEAKKSELALLQSNLDLLESQINPHFIHNTLNTMTYMAKISHADDLAAMISSFNSLLRTSISRNNAGIPFEEEIENLYHYMDIQRYRYDIPIDFKCQISEDSKEIILPKMLLQPLVENSLFHGILPAGGGKLTVKAHLANERLWIAIIDTGVGVKKEILEKLNTGIDKKEKGYNHVGVFNVNERLLLNYGFTSHLIIDTIEGQGTTFHFSIPTTKIDS